MFELNKNGLFKKCNIYQYYFLILISLIIVNAYYIDESDYEMVINKFLFILIIC